MAGNEVEITDLKIVEMVKAGDRQSYAVLVRRHQKGLMRLSLRFVKDADAAADVVQESFIKAYERLETFEGRSSFKSWLYQIAMNTARNQLRDKRSLHQDIEQVHLAIPARAESRLVQNSISEVIKKFVDELPLRQKTALILRVYEDLSFKEIAEIMECPYDTAKANYRHALMKLKKDLSAEMDLHDWEELEGGFISNLTRVNIEVDA